MEFQVGDKVSIKNWGGGHAYDGATGKIAYIRPIQASGPTYYYITLDGMSNKNAFPLPTLPAEMELIHRDDPATR